MAAESSQLALWTQTNLIIKSSHASWARRLGSRGRFSQGISDAPRSLSRPALSGSAVPRDMKQATLQKLMQGEDGPAGRTKTGPLASSVRDSRRNYKLSLENPFTTLRRRPLDLDPTGSFWHIPARNARQAGPTPDTPVPPFPHGRFECERSPFLSGGGPRRRPGACHPGHVLQCPVVLQRARARPEPDRAFHLRRTA